MRPQRPPLPWGCPVSDAAVDPGFSMDLRIVTEGLEPGMYVSQLDRPWKEAGFALEGWMLRNEEDVRRVRALCRHVHVDILRGKAPDSRFVVLDMEQPPGEQAAEPPPTIEREPGPAGEQGRPLQVVRWEAPEGQGEAVEASGAPAGVLEGWVSAVATPVSELPEALSVVPAAQRVGREVFGDELDAARDAHARLEAGIRSALDNARSGVALDAGKLQEGVDAMLDSLGRNPGAMSWVLEMQRKGDYIYRHGIACSIWAATFGRHLGLDRNELRELSLGALLSDVGKVRLPTELLLKAGPLEPDEIRHLRAHVDESRRIVAESAGLSDAIARMVAEHHERHDGSGYPRALRGPQIVLAARIVGLVDSYDAMTSDRGYASRRSPHQAMMELYRVRDRLFEGALVEQFIRVCGVFPTGTLVELSDGTVGVVMAVNALRRLRPVVMLLLDAAKQPLAEFAVVDLARVETDARGEPLTVRAGLPLGSYGLDPAQLFLD